MLTVKKRKPLYEQLMLHKRLDRSSFHTPGHKCSDFLPPELLSLDYTELPDTDALFEADGVIRECERSLSVLYGTADSFISAGGCTLAIQAMLRAAKRQGGRLLLARNAHRSAFNCAALLGLDPVMICPRSSNNYTGRVSPDDIEAAFEREPDITACYITSPTYYGELCDISAIADVCHRHNAILLVDNAHGSHLAFMKENLHPIALGADMSACSLHKTMPVMTGGAALNVRTPELAESAKADMSLFASTSPSYVIMASIDLCIDYMLYGSGKKDYLCCEERVSALGQLAGEKGIIQPSGKCDPLRLTLNTASCGIAGGDRQQEYFSSHGIDCEFCDGENAVFICTPFNSEKDFDRLRRAIEDLPPAKAPARSVRSRTAPSKAMTIRSATLSPSETIPVSEALGRIAADTSCPCPPGVPVIIPGEMIGRDTIQLLMSYGIDRIAVVRGEAEKNK